MPTWYSIRNRLEAGEVSARNEFERFLTSFVTSYGCLDIWYRSVATGSSVLECRVFYIQADDTYVAENEWERDGERPEYWLQLKGTSNEIRASLISLLPEISQLHNTKRHGEWNYGATQPFQGQGSITIDPGNGNVIVTGRFGDIAIYDGGVELNWEDITWEFDGCDVTATAPPGTTICYERLNNSIDECVETDPADPVGTCLRGDCNGGWSANYPETAAECSDGVDWIPDKDLSAQTQDYWNDYQGCPEPDPDGTCVVGTCDLGYTTSYITSGACSALGGIDWFENEDLTGLGSAYWEDFYNCPDPLGCCIVGPECEWTFVGVTTQSECTALGGSWTEGVKGQECTEQYLSDQAGCTDVPETVTVTVDYAITAGQHSSPGYFGGIPGNSVNLPFWWYGDCGITPSTPTGDIECTGVYLPAITPGSSYTHKDFHNVTGTPCVGSGCLSLSWSTEFGFFSTSYSTYTLAGYDDTGGVGNATASHTYVFRRDPDYNPNPNDPTDQRYLLDSTTAGGLSYRTTYSSVSATNDCCGTPTTLYWRQGIPEIFDKSFNATGYIFRRLDTDNVTVLYSGGISIENGAGNITFDESNATCSGIDASSPDFGWFGQVAPKADDLRPSSEVFINWSIPTPTLKQGTLSTTFGTNSVEVPQEYGGDGYLFHHLMPIESFKVDCTITEV